MISLSRSFSALIARAARTRSSRVSLSGTRFADLSRRATDWPSATALPKERMRRARDNRFIDCYFLAPLKRNECTQIQFQKIHGRSVLVAAFRPGELTKSKAGCPRRLRQI